MFKHVCNSCLLASFNAISSKGTTYIQCPVRAHLKEEKNIKWLKDSNFQCQEKDATNWNEKNVKKKLCHNWSKLKIHIINILLSGCINPFLLELSHDSMRVLSSKKIALGQYILKHVIMWITWFRCVKLKNLHEEYWLFHLVLHVYTNFKTTRQIIQKKIRSINFFTFWNLCACL